MVAATGITAGSGTATAELRALILELLDILAHEFPDVLQAFYADEANLETRGSINEEAFPMPGPRVPKKRANQMRKRRAQQMAHVALKVSTVHR